MQSRAPTLSMLQQPAAGSQSSDPAQLTARHHAVRCLVHPAHSSVDHQEQAANNTTDLRATLLTKSSKLSPPSATRASPYKQTSLQQCRFRPAIATPTTDTSRNIDQAPKPAAAATIKPATPTRARKLHLRKSLQLTIPTGSYTDDSEIDSSQRSHVILAAMTEEQIMAQYPPELGAHHQGGGLPLLPSPVFFAPAPTDPRLQHLHSCTSHTSATSSPQLLPPPLLHQCRRYPSVTHSH